MKITNCLFAPGQTGFFFDDQLAIKNGAEHEGAYYKGKPMTPGFTAVRQAGESVCVMLLLEDGSIALGDCAAVQYSGAGGRDPLFLASDYIPLMERYIVPLLKGHDTDNFRLLAALVDSMRGPISGDLLHTAIRYGLTQACLGAVARARKTLMAEVIAEEYGTQVADKPVPIFAQTGDERYLNADKMIMKGVDVLPHGLFNNVEEKIGLRGEKLREYILWLVKRIGQLAPRPDYAPVLHVDVYGTLGPVFNNDFEKIADYIGELATCAQPYALRVEGPVDMGSREAQIEGLRTIREHVDRKGIEARIVADEWCNTLEDIREFADQKAGHMAQIKTPDLGGINNCIEAVMYCKEHGMGAYLGGTCNETDVSARVCAHIAMATGPDQVLAKPGMGMDEGFMIVNNEMRRIVAIRAAR
jgi:methylaspartate ammonia-lyase